MNFLAHLYLTKDYPAEVAVGNFLADAVKGRKALSGFPELIQTGIRIHRQIDHFTDTHPAYRQGTKRLFPNYGKFAGIIMDIFYDHVLANNWNRYCNRSLDSFAQAQYGLITTHWNHLPQRTQLWFHYMVDNNLLVNYARESVVELVLHRMDKRLGSTSGMGQAIHELKAYKSDFTTEFDIVLKDLQTHLSSTF